jgi:hypothetical protein
MAKNRAALREIVIANLEDDPAMDKLGAAITSSTALTLTCTTYTNYFDQAFIEFEETGEVSRVSGEPSSTTITLLKRGMQGTTAATVTTATIVKINPKFYQWQINSDFNDCLSSKVLKTAYNATAVTTVASTRKYNLPAAIKLNRINKVFIYNSDNTKKELILRWNATNVGTGTAGVDQIEFLDIHTASRKIGIEYLAGFTAFTADNVACDLPDNESAQLIPAYYSCYRRLIQKESPRLKKDKATFRRSGTPFGARTKAADEWRRDFIDACRSNGLHPNIEGGGVLTVSYPTIEEY